MDGLARELEAAGLGARVGKAWAGAFYYADDLALAATTVAEAQAMLRIVDRYCREWHFRPSYGKTRQLRFGALRQDDTHAAVPAHDAPRCVRLDTRRRG